MDSDAKHTPWDLDDDALAREIARVIENDTASGHFKEIVAKALEAAAAKETALQSALSLSQSRVELMRKALEEVRNLDRARVRKALAPGEEPNPAAVALAKAGKIASEALSTITTAEGVKKP